MKKPLFLVLFTLLIVGACTKKETVTKTTSGTNPITDGSGTTGTSGTNGSNGNSDVSSCGRLTGNSEIDNYCYKTVTPTIKLHGQASTGNTSFQTANHATIPQSYFETDLKMYVRIVPKPLDFTESTNGSLTQRRCSPTTVDSNQNKYRYSKIRVTLEVVKKGSTYSGDVKTIDATLAPGSLTPSSRVKFNTDGPGEYNIIVRDVKTNHRCSNMGTGDLSCSTYQDIPYVTNTSYPTDCVGFEVQFSTDYTRDLP